MPRRKHPPAARGGATAAAPPPPPAETPTKRRLPQSPSPAPTSGRRFSNPPLSPHKSNRRGHRTPAQPSSIAVATPAATSASAAAVPSLANPRPPSPALSDISTSASEDEGSGPLVPRMKSGSPVPVAVTREEEDEDGGKQTKTEPEAVCQWNECGETFNSLQPFIEHLHHTHIGIHKSKYICEWDGCIRKGKPQTSRFALLSHLRSHTGEKPFTCPRPECDKSFTRSDALSKHMRIQHNIVTPGSRRAAASTLAQPDDEDANMLGEAGDVSVAGAPGGAADSLGDELLELAGGREDIELNSKAGTEGSLETMTAEELGIRDRLAIDSDEEEAKMADVVLAHARREWAKEARERERIRAQRDKDAAQRGGDILTGNGNGAGGAGLGGVEAAAGTDGTNGAKRPVRRTNDYDSDSDSDDGGLAAQHRDAATAPAPAAPASALKRQRTAPSLTSSTPGADREQNGAASEADREREKEEAARRTARNRYLVEKAKVRFLREENKRMWDELDMLQAEERDIRRQSRKALEKALVFELGPDVDAIFSPVSSPGLEAGVGDSQAYPPPYALDESMAA